MKRRYDLHIEPTAHKARKNLPGHVRQQIKRIIDDLAHNPRPHNSIALDLTDIAVPEQIEPRRIKLEKWRIIYAVNDAEQWVWVWGVRQRPPYDYDDLADLIDALPRDE